MNNKYPKQRKTTLKWKSNGELSEFDMLRIVDRISKRELNRCELTCSKEEEEEEE